MYLTTTQIPYHDCTLPYHDCAWLITIVNCLPSHENLNPAILPAWQNWGYSAYRAVRICSTKNPGPDFFAGQTVDLIDNRSIFDRTHHIDFKLKNIRPGLVNRKFLLPNKYCTLKNTFKKMRSAFDDIRRLI